MAIIRLTDILQAELWTSDIINESPVLQNILKSPLLARSSELNSIVNAATAGTRFELPYIDIPGFSELTPVDDSDDLIESRKFSWAAMFAVLGIYAVSYEYMALAALVNKASDPAAVIRDLIAKDFANDLQLRMISTLVGVSKKAGDDLTLEADTDIDAAAIIDAASLLGDRQDLFDTIFVHSKVYADMKKKNLITTIPPSEQGAKPIEMYGNWRVVVNDLMPVETDADGNKRYTTIIAQRGVFAFSQKRLGGEMPPIEYYADPRVGKGGGKKQIIARHGFVLHPVGWSWNKSGFNPTNTDLANPSNWSMKLDKKLQRFVKLVTL